MTMEESNLGKISKYARGRGRIDIVRGMVAGSSFGKISGVGVGC